MSDEIKCENCVWYDHDGEYCQYIQCTGLPDDCTAPLPCEKNYKKYKRKFARRKSARECQQKRREKARQTGLCSICCKNPARPGKKTCDICLARAMNAKKKPLVILIRRGVN